METSSWLRKSGSVMLGLIFTLNLAATQAQSPKAANQNGDNVEARVGRLMNRVDASVQDGTLSRQQATQLKANLASIRSDAASARRKNGGALNQTDNARFQSALNQSMNLISSNATAGKRGAVSGRALGPRWAQGQDGAQNAQKLKQEMKLEEKRELRQERQAMMQVKEQQQQQYEKEMLQKLGSQRPDILKNKQDIDQVRQTSGAN